MKHTFTYFVALATIVLATANNLADHDLADQELSARARRMLQQPARSCVNPTCTSSPCAARLLGDVGCTIVAGVAEYDHGLIRKGETISASSHIYGPFEAGFTTRQDNIIRGWGCADPSVAYDSVGGKDIGLAERETAYKCDMEFPRIEGNRFIGVVGKCGGHTHDYHFHRSFSCLYKEEGGHSTAVGQVGEHRIYGKWEDFSKKRLPLLDACGGHWGPTPDCEWCYHYHVQDRAPYTVGCMGPAANGGLVSISTCRALYGSKCGDGTEMIAVGKDKAVEYDRFCPCYDADGSNVGTKELPALLTDAIAVHADTGEFFGGSTTPSTVARTTTPSTASRTTTPSTAARTTTPIVRTSPRETASTRPAQSTTTKNRNSRTTAARPSMTGGKKPTKGGPTKNTNSRTTAARSAQPRTSVSKPECNQPVKASRDTCTMETAKALGKACGRQLGKACHEAGMGFGKPGGKKPTKGTSTKNTNSRTTAARPAQPRTSVSKPDCNQPVKASRDTCTMETAKALGEACGRQLGKACHEAGMGFGKPGDKKPTKGAATKNTNSRTTAARPAQPRTSVSKPECNQPVKASRDTCTMETAKALGKACGHKLAKACHEAGMGFKSMKPSNPKQKDCGTVKPSKQTCTSAGLRAVFGQKPQCVLKLKDMCKQLKDSENVAAPIPSGCVKWFDGCNSCTVREGKATSCSKKFCRSQAQPFCAVFADERSCKVSRATRKIVCKKAGDPVTKPPAKMLTCDDIASDLDLSDEDTCRKASYLCAGEPDIIRDCKAKKEDDEKEKCKATSHESRKAKCCVEGKLEGTVCKAFGDRDTLPEDCKTRCFDNDGKFKQGVKECVRCRGKGALRATEGGKPGDKGGEAADNKGTKQPFDPARVKETIKEIASGLNEDGKKCVKRIAKATASLKARLTRWRKNKPAAKEEPEAETESKSLAEVQAEVEETIEQSKSVEDEFEDDDEGKTYREKEENEDKRMKNKMTDSSKPKNQQCRAAFEALRNNLNDVVDKYANLPATLKARGVARVRFAFADTDIGRTDLKSSESVCKFASKYVSQLKKAETHHKTRLAAARKLLCTEAGELLKKKLISKLSNCLRKAKREAQDGDAKRDADADAQNFDQNTRKHVQKLLSLMKQKCLMKDSPDSELAPVTQMFQGKLRTRINKKAGGLTNADRKEIAQTVNDAVQKQHPEATDIVTTIEDSQRRQLRARRALAASSSVDVETTWTASEAPTASGSVELGQALGADFESSAPEITSEPSAASIEVTQPLQPIDDRLPGGGEETGTTKKVGVVTTEAGSSVATHDRGATTAKAVAGTTIEETVAVSDGAMQIAFSAVTVMCTTLLIMLT